MKSKVKYDIFYVKQFVRFLHEIFCIFCRFVCIIFHAICCEILLCNISRNILCYVFPEYFTYFTPCLNNSTYFTIWHFISTSMQKEFQKFSVLCLSNLKLVLHFCPTSIHSHSTSLTTLKMSGSFFAFAL